MGELLQDKHLVPDFIVSSTAKRAHSTAKTVAKAAGYKGDITLNQSLYAAASRAYIDVLRDLSNKYVRVLMVGHNPGELVDMLTGVHVQLRYYRCRSKKKELRLVRHYKSINIIMYFW
jgi:phosphohistidine phosphatase